MIWKTTSCIIIFLFIFTISGTLLAQDSKKKEIQKSRYILQRINGKVTLDGLSEEAAWKGIKPLPVVMHIPDFGKNPSEKTEIFIAYDNEYLYVAGRLYDSEPSKIQAVSKKRDTIGPSNDWFGIVIDTFNDKENALCFGSL